MLEFVKQSKKRKLYCILGILYLLCIIFVANDAWLYSTPIAKLTKVETSVSGEETGTRGTKEKKYKQNIQGVILNGENKGKTISFTNECTYTGMMKQPYHKGDKVLLNGTSKRMGSGIRGLKRDTELMILIGFLMFILIIVAGRQGALTILTVIFNVAVFATVFWKAGDTSNVLEMCSRLVILFAVITLVGLNGIHKKTWAALFTTLIVLVMIMGIFDVVIHHAEDLDYSTMEYLGSIENPDEIFHAEAIELTAVYIRICGSGIFFIVAYNLLSAIFRGLGDSKSPLLFVLVACIINVFGDLILVAGFHMNAAGAAIATVFAQAISVVFAVVLLIKKELPFKIRKKDFCLNPQCKKFLIIGLPLALQEFLTQMSFLALCAFVNRLGLEASSGYGVACKIVNFAMLVPSALMQSMASFVSQNVGAGKAKRAKKSMFTGIGVGLVVGCFVFTLVFLKGDVLAGFFSTDAAVIQNGFAYLRGFAPETIVTAVLFSMVGYFNGNDRTLWVMTQGLIQTLLVRLPMAYIMSIQPNASLTKIGLAAPVSTAVGIMLNVGFYVYLNRKK